MTIERYLIAAGLALAGPAVVMSAVSAQVAASGIQGATTPVDTSPEARPQRAGQTAPRSPTRGTAAGDKRAERVPVLPVRIVARYPHDRTAFTEGLLWHAGALFESTGKEDQSEVRQVNLADGRIVRKRSIDPRQFGEGLALWNGNLISLTWHDGIAHRWDVRTLQPKGTSRYTGEGWGLTSDGRTLIQSDGSSALILRDPATLEERRRIAVTIDGRALPQLNELEYVEGTVLANVWQTGFLVRIDPATGRVTAILDLRPLVAEIGATDRDAVLNGIAWDAKGKRLFVTGKLWPTLFEIQVAQ